MPTSTATCSLRPPSRTSCHANRELSAFDSYTISAGASYEFKMPHAPWLTKSTANVRFEHLIFDYKDYRDAPAD